MKFQIPGNPKPWQRVKVGRYGNVYDPNQKHKKYIGQLAFVASSENGYHKLKGSLMASMTFYVSNHRRKDLDNLIKNIMDALNMVLYDDDSQIVKLLAAKIQCSPGEEKTEVELFPIH